MQQNKTQLIPHTIAGGWATDYGTTYYGAPDQSGTLSLPWLNKARNIQFNNDGSISKFTGTAVLNSTPLYDIFGNTKILNVFDYWRMGTGGTPVQKVVGRVGTAIFAYDSGSSGIIPGANGIIAANVPAHFSLFNDLMIVAASGGAPYSWDQTTFQALAGTPPNFGFSTPHKGRHWAAGNNSVPNRLYYSAVGNPEDWVGAGSGSIDIDPGDGSKIVGLLSWKGDLWVFKGPYRPSIHRITGAAPADFARVPFIYGITAAHQNAIFPMGDDFGFWSSLGTCHSLTATANYGDYVQSYLNYPILGWCRDSGNMTSGSTAEYWQAVTDPIAGYTLLMYKDPINGTATGDLIGMDWKFKSRGEDYPRFFQLTLDRVCSLAYGYNTVIPDAPQILIGDTTGVLHRSGANTQAFRGVDLRTELETPAITYGTEIVTKTPSMVSLSLDPLGESNIAFSWGGPGIATQTTTLVQPSGGALLGVFVLGTDVLGEYTSTISAYAEMNGEYRSIRYNLVSENAAYDMKLRQMNIEITTNAATTEDTL